MAQEQVQLEIMLAQQSAEMAVTVKKESVSQEFYDIDDSFRISEVDALKFLNNSLDVELQESKQKFMQLNASNGYLETARNNMLARKVQEETLEYRINQELASLNEIRGQQEGRFRKLTKELKSTE